MQRTILNVARAQRTEIYSLSGKTFSFAIQRVNGVSVTLYEKSQTNSSRYHFLLFDNTGKSTIYRASKGNIAVKRSKDTHDVQGPDPQRRTIWIDFRSDNLVLGSGGEVLVQWKDPFPFPVNYVSITANATTPTTIDVFNKPHNRKLLLYIYIYLCFSDWFMTLLPLSFSEPYCIR